MGHGLLLQDWVTVASSGTVIQPASTMGKVSGYRDAVAYVRVSSITTSLGTPPTLTLQTAPTIDDSLFQSIHSTASFATSVGLTTVTLNDAVVTVPIGRYVRWRLNGSGTWGITFRIWLTLAS